MPKKPPRAKKKHEADPEPEPTRALIMELAKVKGWAVGPTKDSDCTLTLKLEVSKFENVEAIRQLARGSIVLHILPLQWRLDEAQQADECPHGVTLDFTPNRKVCVVCGLIIEIPLDDQPKTPSGEPGTPMVLFCATHTNQALDEAGACPLCGGTPSE